MVGPQMRKQAVVVMRSEVAVSERRACGLIGLHRGTYRYRARGAEDERLRGCASWRTGSDALAIAGCMTG